MGDLSHHTSDLLRCLDRLQAGDESARAALINHACSQLTRLTRSMLRGFPRVKRWEQTDDIMQNASLRLWNALKEVKPRTLAEFFGLAAMQIRRELLDVSRQIFGPCGHGAHHDSAHNPGSRDTSSSEAEPSDTTHEPAALAQWTELHRQIEALPEDERQVFDLLYYQELTQEEAAELLQVSDRTIRKRWRTARMRLSEALQGDLP